MGGIEGWPEYDQACVLVDQILEHSEHEYRTYNLLGGEPTLWRHFGDLCTYIKHRDRNSIIQVLTNGSRTVRWWRQYAPYMNKVVISHHSHTANAQHTVEVVDICQPYNSVSVQMLMDYYNFDKCVNHFEHILKHCPGISVSIKKAETELGSGVWQPYTPLQLDQMKEMQELSKENARKNSRINRIASYDARYVRSFYATDGQTEWETSNKDLILNDQNHFRGWHCNIGRDMLCVKANGDLKPASACFKDEYFGNYRRGDKIMWPRNSYVCAYDNCTCGADIEVEKHAPQ